MVLTLNTMLAIALSLFPLITFRTMSKFFQMTKFFFSFSPLFFRSSKLLRAFYVPFLSDQYTVYANYTILKPRKAKQIRKKSGG